MSVFVDASAIVAILAREEDADALSDRLDRFEGAITSPIAVFESSLGIAKTRRGKAIEAADDLRGFLEIAQMSIIAITDEYARAAVVAFTAMVKAAVTGRN